MDCVLGRLPFRGSARFVSLLLARSFECLRAKGEPIVAEYLRKNHTQDLPDCLIQQLNDREFWFASFWRGYEGILSGTGCGSAPGHRNLKCPSEGFSCHPRLVFAHFCFHSAFHSRASRPVVSFKEFRSLAHIAMLTELPGTCFFQGLKSRFEKPSRLMGQNDEDTWAVTFAP